MLLGHADAGMAEQYRDLVDGDSSQEHFDGEGIAEHVTMGALGSAVRLAQIGHFEEAAIGTLPVGDKSFGQTIATPEKIVGIWLQSWGDRAKQIGDVWRQWDKDGDSGLRLIQQQLVLLQTRAFQRDRIADSKAAPAHQLGQSPNPHTVLIGVVGPLVVLIEMLGGIDDPGVIGRREVIRRHVFGDHPAHHCGWILSDPSMAHAEPEEADNAFKLLLPGQRLISP